MQCPDKLILVCIAHAELFLGYRLEDYLHVRVNVLQLKLNIGGVGVEQYAHLLLVFGINTNYGVSFASNGIP